MRALGARPADTRRLAGVVTVHAANYRILCQRIDQARDVGTLARRSDGVKRNRVRLNLQTDVGLVMLPRRSRGRLVRAVAVTPQAYFIGVDGLADFGTSDIHAADVVWRIAGAATSTRRVRVMAIGALDVARIDDRRLGRIMDKRRVGHTMRRKLREALHDIL